jgi:DNA-binding PadR family transcriptional regulator
MHPYEMASTMRTRAKHESIKLNYGTLYGVVESLQGAGLIEPHEVEREGRRPERTVYRITDTGLIEFGDWLGDLISTPVKEYTQFEAGLSLIVAMAPDDALALLKERGGRLSLRIAAERSAIDLSAQHNLPRVFAVETEYRVALLQAELEFVRELIARIEDGSLDGLDWWRRAHAELARAHAEGRPPEIQAPDVHLH